jgi:hypothetical protein
MSPNPSWRKFPWVFAAIVCLAGCSENHPDNKPTTPLDGQRKRSQILTIFWHRRSCSKSLRSFIPSRSQDRRRVEKGLGKEKTSLFDTHPSYSDRLASVQKENSAGIFHLDQPATVLFSDFPKLAQDTSLALYRRLFGKRVQRNDLFPVAGGLPE